MATIRICWAGASATDGAKVKENERAPTALAPHGDDVHPAWYLNLQANPDVEVKWKGAAAKPYTARTATPEERAELWGTVTSKYKNYAGYQTKTEREIPLIVLRPAAS